MDSIDSAQLAKCKMNGFLLDGTTTPLQVDYSDHDFTTTHTQSAQTSGAGGADSRSIFITGVPYSLSWDRLKCALQHFGGITECSKKRNSNCGFFRFETPESAKSVFEYFRSVVSKPNPKVEVPSSADHGLSDSDSDGATDRQWLREIASQVRVDYAEPMEVREARQKRGAERTATLQQAQAKQDRMKASSKRASHGAGASFQTNNRNVLTSNNSASLTPQQPAIPQLNNNTTLPTAVFNQAPPTYFIMAPPMPTFPMVGDMYIAIKNFDELMVRQLLARFGPVSLIASINPGYCVRMADPMMHQPIILALNNATLAGGSGEPIQAFLVASLR